MRTTEYEGKTGKEMRRISRPLAVLAALENGPRSDLMDYLHRMWGENGRESGLRSLITRMEFSGYIEIEPGDVTRERDARGPTYRRTPKGDERFARESEDYTREVMVTLGILADNAVNMALSLLSEHIPQD